MIDHFNKITLILLGTHLVSTTSPGGVALMLGQQNILEEQSYYCFLHWCVNALVLKICHILESPGKPFKSSVSKLHATSIKYNFLGVRPGITIFMAPQKIQCTANFDSPWAKVFFLINRLSKIVSSSQLPTWILLWNIT